MTMALLVAALISIPFAATFGYFFGIRRASGMFESAQEAHGLLREMELRAKAEREAEARGRVVTLNTVHISR